MIIESIKIGMILILSSFVGASLAMMAWGWFEKRENTARLIIRPYKSLPDRKVVVEVYGGVADIIECPDDVDVEIKEDNSDEG